MGLSAGDKDIVRSGWAKVKANMEGHGVGFYQKFLGENPQYKANFKKFSSVDVADYPGNAALKAQAAATFSAVEKCVNNMDDPSAIQARMAALAGTHKGYGIALSDIYVGFSSLLAYLSGALSLDGAGVSAWTNLVEEMKSGLAANY